MDELIRKHSDIQELLDKTLMEIGLKYSYYTLTQEKSLIDKINKKVELFQKLEAQMQIIEDEIRKMNN